MSLQRHAILLLRDLLGLSSCQPDTTVKPRPRSMFAEVLEYRQLLYMLAWRDVKIRYKQSIMGFLWAILMPALIIIAGVLVRYGWSMRSGGSFTFSDLASVSLKSAPWAFFVSAIRFATNSLSGNGNLVTKIYFPREVFPLSAVLAALFDFAVSSGAIVIILIAARVGFSRELLWLPVLLVLLVSLTAGLAMLLACANVFFRDVKYLVEIFLTFGILFTPVFYEVRMFGKYAPILLLNPVAAILEAMNNVVVLHRPPEMFWLAYVAAWAFGGSALAWRIFDRTEPYLAEIV